MEKKITLFKKIWHKTIFTQKLEISY